jgi:hypothetical protein
MQRRSHRTSFRALPGLEPYLPGRSWAEQAGSLSNEAGGAASVRSGRSGGSNECGRGCTASGGAERLPQPLLVLALQARTGGRPAAPRRTSHPATEYGASFERAVRAAAKRLLQ